MLKKNLLSLFLSLFYLSLFFVASSSSSTTQKNSDHYSHSLQPLIERTQNKLLLQDLHKSPPPPPLSFESFAVLSSGVAQSPGAQSVQGPTTASSPLTNPGFFRVVARQTLNSSSPISAFSPNSWSLNANNPNADNFAILDQLNKYRITQGSYAGKFRFRLVWPILNKLAPILGAQEWIQSSNPKESYYVIGYTPLSISYTSNCWGGLLAHPSQALLTGSTCNGLYWYAVGLYQIYQGTGIPAADTVVNQVELLVWDDTPQSAPAPAPAPAPGSSSNSGSSSNLGSCTEVTCLSQSRYCNQPSTCCSGLCTNGVCTCLNIGQSCSEDRNCCTGTCSPSNICTSGIPTGLTCTFDNQCNSRNCIGGLCDSERPHVLVPCPTGKTAISGGGKCAFGSAMLRSAPYTDGSNTKKWGLVCENVGFEAYAFCC